MTPSDPIAGSGPQLPGETERARLVLARCREIATHTEVPGQITRTFLSPPMHGVHHLLRGWMEAAGMHTSVDAAGNLRGVRPATAPGARRIILGSHLDTVPNAGAFDGILGVVMAVAAVEGLQGEVPVTLEIIGFSEEEGVRFRKPFLGSLALVGRLDAHHLDLRDSLGISVADALRNFDLDPARIPEAKLSPDTVAYLEIHIEQGPVLDAAAQAMADSSAALERPPSNLGVVDALVGQSRLHLTFHGQANHAGTTPMHLRHDALAAAAEWIVAVETLARKIPGLVATVGRIEAEPGAANVIPGLVHASLDVRHADDATRERAVADLLARASAAAGAREVRLTQELVLEQTAVPMDTQLVHLLHAAIVRAGHVASIMPSGAGHDAMILAPHVPSVMLFLPSPGGLSHHPDEAVLATDIEAGLQALLELLKMFDDEVAFSHA